MNSYEKKGHDKKVVIIETMSGKRGRKEQWPKRQFRKKKY